MFDAFARVAEQPTMSERFYRFTSSMGAVSFGLGTAAQVARHRDRLDPNGGLGAHRLRVRAVQLSSMQCLSVGGLGNSAVGFNHFGTVRSAHKGKESFHRGGGIPLNY